MVFTSNSEEKKYESADLLTTVCNLSLKMEFVPEELKMVNVIQFLFFF